MLVHLFDEPSMCHWPFLELVFDQPPVGHRLHRGLGTFVQSGQILFLWVYEPVNGYQVIVPRRMPLRDLGPPGNQWMTAGNNVDGFNWRPGCPHGSSSTWGFTVGHLNECGSGLNRLSPSCWWFLSKHRRPRNRSRFLSVLYEQRDSSVGSVSPFGVG